VEEGGGNSREKGGEVYGKREKWKKITQHWGNILQSTKVKRREPV